MEGDELMPKWLITYHTITQESAEQGDYADSGFLMSGGHHVQVETEEDREAASFDSLKAALRYCSPVYDMGSSFESHPDTDYRTGADEYRSLQLPKGITAASRRRLKRVLGVRS
jgi:hypothetical protein